MNLTGILLSICIILLATTSLASRHREKGKDRTKTGSSRKHDCRSDRPKKRHTDDADVRLLTPGQPTTPPEACSDCKCMWTYYIDQDDNRIPREMFFANCSNGDCNGDRGLDGSCRKTYYTMTVLRRSIPSTDVWEMAEESVPTACVCREPGRSTTNAY